MCKTDKDCSRGQTCTSGTCTGTAVDELADTEPQQRTEPEDPMCSSVLPNLNQ